MLRLLSLLFISTLVEGNLDAADFLRHLYWHDPDKLTSALNAQGAFTEARHETAAVWETLLNNQELGYQANRERLQRSARIRFETIVGSLEDLTWEKIWMCAEGNCETAPPLAGFPGVTTEDLEAISNLYPKGSTNHRLTNALGNIEVLAGQIESLERKIRFDPDGNKALAGLPAGDVDKPLTELKQEFQNVISEIDDNTAELRNKIMGAITKMDEIAEKAEKALSLVMDGDPNTVNWVDTVVGILQKKDLIRDHNITETLEGGLAALIDKGGKTPLPDGLIAAIKADVIDQDGAPLEVKTVGELLKFLGSEHAEIEEIRISLLSDLRESLVEMRAARMNELNAMLAIQKRRLKVLEAQKAYENALSIIKTKVEGFAHFAISFQEDDFGNEGHFVLRMLEAQQKAYQEAGEDRGRIREEFGDVILFLGRYMERVGYLRDAEVLVDLEELSLAHRLSIKRSQLATKQREAMLARGLEALVSFEQGGITTDDVANGIRFVQTALLAAIAGTN